MKLSSIFKSLTPTPPVTITGPSHQDTETKVLPPAPAIMTSPAHTETTPQVATPILATTPYTTIISVPILAFLLLLGVGGVLVLVCCLRFKASRREGKEGTENEEIHTEDNKAYGQVVHEELYIPYN
jgi:hypothetical protein